MAKQDETALVLANVGEFTMEAADEMEKKLAASGGKASFFKLADGRNVLRFLPPPKGKNNPFASVMQHYVKLPTGDVSFNCPRFATPPRACPVCAQANTYKASKSKKDQDRAGDLLPRTRIYANIIDRANEDMGPQVFGFGKSIYNDLMKIYKDPDWGNFTHPTQGCDITINKTGANKNTEYSVNPRPKSGMLSNDVAKARAWIDNQHSLDKYLAVPTDDEIAQKLMGGPEQDENTNTAGTVVYDTTASDEDRPF